MEPRKIQRISLENLLIDLENPRHDPRINQREALATIAGEQSGKLLNLAEDIVDKGLSPFELPMVTPIDDGNTFVVLEGNRRIAALKLILSPELLNSLGLPRNIVSRYKQLQAAVDDNFPRELECAVVPAEEADYWILLKHTGENKGVGVVPWNGRARQRFRGSSPALQAIEMVEKSSHLDDETKKRLPKIAITNVKRILDTPDARKLLGVDIKDGQLIVKNPEEALPRLAMVVADVANKQIKVTDLDNKGQRIEYAEKIAARPLPGSFSPNPETPPDAPKVPPPTNGTGKAPPAPKRLPVDRRFLIPRQCVLRIPQIRINRIYSELQKLDVNDYINSCAVLMRVFVELSIDDFAARKSIPLVLPPDKPTPKNPNPSPKDMSLRQKINAVVKFLEQNNLCTKHELKGIKSLASSKDHVLSVDSLNAYVHNKNYSPTPTDLKANWDSIEPFIKAIWA
jgi:hypothetical protein